MKSDVAVGETLSLIIDKCRATQVPGQPGGMTFVNPASYVKLRSRPDLLRPINAIGCDGTLSVLALRALGVAVRRRSMDLTSMATDVLRAAARENLVVYLVGSEEGIANSAGGALAGLFPGLRIAGTRSGFFAGPSSEDKAVAVILEAGADIVLIGMGVVRQEEFLLRLMASPFSGTAYTCGAFLEQTASRQGAFYPHWVDKMNLRFAYRICKQPRLISRYTLTYGWAVLLFAHDAIRYRWAHRMRTS